jgi:hypothetical protein
MAGTGLPIPKTGGVLAEEPGPQKFYDGDKFSSARDWLKIAAAGDSLAKTGMDALERESKQQQVGYLGEKEVEITRKRIELQSENAENPNGFDAAWNGYKEGILSSAPEWSLNHLKTKLGNEGNAAYSAVLTQTNSKNQAIALNGWNAAAELESNNFLGAAMAGSLGNDDGKAVTAKLRGVMDSGVSHRFLSPEEADRRVAVLTSQAHVYSMRGAVKSEYEVGGALKANDLIDRVTRDEKLQLSPDQRYAMASRLRADVHALEAERSASFSAAEEESKALLSAKAGGVAIPRERTEQAAERLKQYGGPSAAARFLSDMTHAEDMSFLTRIPARDAATWLNDYKISRGLAVPPSDIKTVIEEGAAATGVPTGFLVKVAAKESGFNTSAQASTSSAGGMFQFTDGTWKDTLSKYGAKHGLSANTPKTDARAATLMAGELTQENGRALTASGVPVNEQTLYLAHFAGAQGAVSLMQADPNARAADILPDAAKANRSIFFDQQGVARSVGQMVGRLTSSFGGGSATNSDLEFAGKANNLVHERVSTEIDGIVTEMGKNLLPTPERIEGLYRSAIATNDTQLMQKFATAAEEYQFRRDIGRLPAGDEVAYLNRLRTQGATIGVTQSDARRVEIAQSVIAETQKGLNEDALSHTVKALELPPPAPLDMRNSDGFIAGLKQRADIARRGASTFQTGPLAALSKSELVQVGAALETADPAGKTRIFSDLTTALPEDVRNATFAKLGEKNPSAMVSAYAGALYSKDANISVGIVTGWSALSANPKFDPAREGQKEEFGAAFDKAFPASTVGMASRTTENGALATIRNATRAYYGYLSAQAGDTSGEFKESRLTDAVRAVTGGVAQHNGAPLVVPSRGMSQRDFDGVMAGISDNDLAGVTTLSGTPITAKYLRENAKLESVGDGRYRVLLGDDPANPVYAVKGADAWRDYAPARPFHLDLRGRQSAPIRPANPYSELKPYPRG